MNFWILIAIIAVLILVLLLTRKTREQIVGICNVAMEQTVRKNANKEKIMAVLGEPIDPAQGKRELSNADIREALGVSERSVIRYMDELEREGKVEQVGNTGRNVTYRLKQ